jgi:YD repeat-containing protein
VRDRRFAGFEKITKQDGLGITQTYYHQGDTASTTGGELTDSFALLGKPYREDVLSSSSNTLKKAFYRWDSVNIGSVATTTAGNSHSLDLESSSSQYASISDLNQVGLDFSNDLTLGAWVKFETLTTGGNYGAPGVFDNGTGLQGWWKLEAAYSDASGNGNTLTAQGSPVFTTDVPYTSGGGSGSAADNYTYAETNYANPHALTAFFNGAATTTYAYDAIGNLATTTGAATSTFMWDYRNRMIRAWVSGATSTYQYDHTIARMAQITPTTTTQYPSKFYSVEYAGVSTTTGTSTSYIFHGDTLVAYIEQAMADGVATGTPTTYYVHPDHLGSTNVVTDENGDVVEALDSSERWGLFPPP